MASNDTPVPAPAVTWESLEAFARQEVQTFVQRILEDEVIVLLGRRRSERRAAVDAPVGYRNGFGKPRRLSMQTGTITLRRPRLRGLAERFASRVLPLFERRTNELGELLPELYLHGLALGDFELRCAACSATAHRSWRVRSRGSRPAGSSNTRSGAGGVGTTGSWCTSGPTGCT